MSDSFIVLKRQELQNRRDSLVAEFKVANTQWGYATNAVDRLQRERQIDQLGRQIEQVEEELRIITAATLPSKKDVIEIQVAVIAMTYTQAKVIETTVDEGLSKLKEALHTFQVKDIVSSYGESPNDWVPLFVEQPTSIKTIIQDLVERLNRANTGLLGRPIISVHYLSDEFLSPIAAERRKAWDTFEVDGGVLIVDALSMYHQEVRDHLLKSQLISANSSVGMIVLSPLRSNAVAVNELLHSQVYAAHLERAFNYFVDHLNPLYEFGVGDVYNLQRWLFSTLPNIRPSRLSPEVRAAIQAQAGVAPSGIGGFVTGSMPL